jgi:hypothetical protein
MDTNIIQRAIETGRLDLAAHVLLYAVLLQITGPGSSNPEYERQESITRVTGGREGAKKIKTRIPKTESGNTVCQQYDQNRGRP